MDSRHGLDYIVENAEYTTKLGAGMFRYTLRVLRIKVTLKIRHKLIFEYQKIVKRLPYDWPFKL